MGLDWHLVRPPLDQSPGRNTHSFLSLLGSSSPCWGRHYGNHPHPNPRWCVRITPSSLIMEPPHWTNWISIYNSKKVLINVQFIRGTQELIGIEKLVWEKESLFSWYFTVKMLSRKIQFFCTCFLLVNKRKTNYPLFCDLETIFRYEILNRIS